MTENVLLIWHVTHYTIYSLIIRTCNMFFKQILRFEFRSRDRYGTFRHIYVYVNEKLVVFEQNCVYSQKPHFYTIKWNFENFRCSCYLQFKTRICVQKCHFQFHINVLNLIFDHFYSKFEKKMFFFRSNSHFKHKTHIYSSKSTIWLSNQRFRAFSTLFFGRFYSKIEKHWRFWSKISILKFTFKIQNSHLFFSKNHLIAKSTFSNIFEWIFEWKRTIRC